ncbi:2-oxo-hept-4-ene-1,7-dioate hydratase [Pandoraea pulmonicola]|uniref:2-oxo-hepta-3-ene-1,7-dioic acid hydratase n=1 Tax=Pandoraea pulmonicola TaxID=93221 RepID=A0AAJ5D2K2_PANPU|nr:2-oxo-hepta-3-ene-1,7-dioic acid hydratase [Pandoraea pulmonicola]AJC22756.1 2-oxo-hepta-3-ene-1,7-dioic acid hydratase [Pandoraea pulmonicola]SUA92976.1 2-oxopent-4-enoate hydratase [Pandoraea pulmonicola]
MLGDNDIQIFAQQLDAAEQSRKQIKQISLVRPEITIAEAYAIQRAWIDAKLARGRKIIGHKIGLTSRAMQMASRIDEPDFGVLLDNMLWEDGGEIDCARLIVPRVEVELAFVLGRTLTGPDVTLWDVLDATRYVVPALEIIDARSEPLDAQTGLPRKVFDTIADNAANAGVILGGRPVRPADVDLRWVGAFLQRNGVIEETGLAAGVLNHPANGVAWLARRLAAFETALQPGQIILAGSFTRPVHATPGDTFHADFGPLGSVSCRFV